MDYYGDGERNEPVSIKRYICYYLLCYIPFVGLIWTIVKAFDKNENPSYSNMCKAQLIMMLVGMCVLVFMWILIIFMAVGITAVYS